MNPDWVPELVETKFDLEESGVAWITLDRPDRFNSLDVRTAQDLRRAGLVTPSGSEDPSHVGLFYVVEGGKAGRRFDGNRSDGQMTRPDHVPGGYDHGPGEAVLQLTDVAGPGMGAEGIGGVG